MEENTTPGMETPDKEPVKKAISLVPRIEILIIVVFFGSFLIWAANRCTSTRKKFQEIERQAQVEDSIYNSAITFEEANSQSSDPLTSEPSTPATVNPQNSTPPPAVVGTREKYTPLYVTLPNLNLRDRPNLSGRILARLKLFDEVEFLNEVTQFQQEINLGDTTTVAPWVKVKTQKGNSGWVYGAGVYYYKIELLPNETNSVQQ